MWMARGEGDKEAGKATVFADFHDAVTRALAETEAASIAMIELAARGGNWKAAAWRLERMFPARYGVRAKVDHSGETKVKHELPQIHDDRETVIEILKETGGLEAVMAWTDSLDPRKA